MPKGRYNLYSKGGVGGAQTKKVPTRGVKKAARRKMRPRKGMK